MDDYRNLVGMRLDRYELEELLSDESGIVATYRAEQPSLRRSVAVQVLSPQLQAQEEYRRGFLRSAEIIAELEHSNIVPVHDYGVDNELAYIVTRLMTGGSLRDRLGSGMIAVQEAATIVRQIGNALEFVHSRGMAHGDPSVSNIVFDNWGSAYIANFHVAGFQTVGGIIVGTPAYTAPEKWLSGVATPETDQYALACISYQMITGYSPLEADASATIKQPKKEFPVPAHTLNPDVPAALHPVMTRALARQPKERYPTVMDFAREFEKALAVAPRHLFISYSRRDKAYAQLLSDHLQHNGFGVWIDANIEYGDAWFDEIDEAIKTCAAFVLVMSPESQESEWVRKEILLAKRYKKALFPLLLEGEEFPIVIDIQFADVKGGVMPDTTFHRRLRRAVFGDA